MRGGEGDDRYVFNSGFGQDTYQDSTGTGTSSNSITFGPGILPANIQLTATITGTFNSFATGELNIIVGAGADRITLKNGLASLGGVEPIAVPALVRFSDGTVWSVSDLANRMNTIGGAGSDFLSGTTGADVITGLAGNDYISGRDGNDNLSGDDGNDRITGDAGSDIVAGGNGDDFLYGGDGNDILIGGPGNDDLYGGLGDDTYKFERGFGNDLVIEATPSLLNSRVFTSNRNGSAGGFDTIEFGASIAPAEIIVTADPLSTASGRLFLTLSGTSDQVILDHWFSNSLSDFQGDNVEQVRFNDGTVWQVNNLYAKAFQTTSGADVFYGSFRNDIVNGSGGDDVLFGWDGNDVLIGGAGTDRLTGNAGNDTYVFGRGSGQDSVFDFDPTLGNFDTIALGDGISAGDLAISRDEDNIYVNINGTQDQLAIRWFSHSAYKIERVQFTDHSYWDATILEQLANGGISGAPYTVPDPVADQTVAQGSAFSLRFSATAFFETLDSSHVYAYSASLSDGSGLPGWLTFDSNSRTFGGTPGDSDVGAIDVKVIAAEKVAGASIGTYSIPDTFRLTVTSTAVNHQPVLANPISNQSTLEDAQFNFFVPIGTFSDADAGDTFMLSATRADDSALPAWVRFNPATGALTGTPGNNDVGTFSVKLTATDSGGLNASDTFDLSVINTNDAPVAATDNVVVDENATTSNLVSTLLANDTDVDVGDTRSITLVNSTGTAGVVSFNQGLQTLTYAANGGAFDALATGVTAIDTFSYTIADAVGASSTATATVTVSGINDGPVATADAISVLEDATPANLASALLANDTDVDVGDTRAITSVNTAGTAGTVSFDQGTQTLTYAANGAAQNALRAGVTATDSFNYTIADAAGATSTATATITVTGVNDGPVANADAVFVLENATTGNLVGNLLLNDTDVDVGDMRTITSVNTAGTVGTVSFNQGVQTLTYAANGAAFDALRAGVTATDTFSYTITDTAGASSTATATVTVTGVNDGPVANADTLSVLENATTGNLVSNLLANDFDVDVGDTRSITAVNTAGTLGVVTFNQGTQTLSYAANGATLNALKAGATATDTFTYTIADGAGATSTTTATLTITGVNDAPTLANAIADQSATQGVTFSFTAASNTFADVDLGDTLTYTATMGNDTALPSWLTFDAATRTFSGTPGAANVGDLALKLTATDTGNLSVADVFNLAVTGGSTGLTLIGTPNKDVLTGGAGDDTIDGRANSDLLLGNGGNDTFQYFADGVWTGGFVARNDGSPGNPGTGKTAAIAGKNRSFDVFQGGPGTDVLLGTAGNDAIFLDDSYSAFPGTRVPRLAGIERIEGGAGNDVIDLTSSLYAYTDVTIDGGDGNDALWGSSGNDVLLGSGGNDDLFGGAGQDYLMGGGGNDTLNGDRGNDLLEGDEGNDALTDSFGNNLLYAKDGNDSLAGGVGNEAFIGGKGNDTITTGTGADVIGFNFGDGHDTVTASTGQDNTVSLGGGIRYSDLFLSKQGNSLVLQTAVNEDITFKDWYSSANNRSVLNLQVVAEAMSDFAPGGSDTLRDNKVERFNFNHIVQKFDQARAASASNANHWSVMNSLLDAHLAGSDTEAIGGDLASRYGLNGTLSGIAINAAQSVLASPQFGSAPQALQPLAGLQDGLVKLG